MILHLGEVILKGFAEGAYLYLDLQPVFVSLLHCLQLLNIFENSLNDVYG